MAKWSAFLIAILVTASLLVSFLFRDNLIRTTLVFASEESDE